MIDFLKSRFVFKDMSLLENLIFFLPLFIAFHNIYRKDKRGINYKLIIYLVLFSGATRFIQPIYRSLTFAYVAIPGLRRYRKEEKKDAEKQNWEKLHKKYSKKTLNVINNLGGIYYKVGQVFGSRSDVSPEIYQETLSCLLDNVPPEPYKKIKKKLKHILPLLDSIDKKTIASASIGQVYKAYYQNKPVVIKVLYSNIESQTYSDLFVLKLWTKKALPSIKSNVDAFTDITMSEFNFKKEANIYDLMKQEINIPNVYFPTVYKELVSKDVLVLEYINGISLLEFIYKSDYQSNLSIIKKVFEVTIKQIYQLGVFTTDPHPGNFLIIEKNEIQVLVPLDFGQVARFNQQEKNCFRDLMFAISSQNTDQINIALEKAGFKSRYNNQTFKNYYINSMFNTIQSYSSNKLNEFELNNSIDEWITVPINFNLVSKTITTLVGICSLAKIYDLSFADVFISSLNINSEEHN